AAHAELIRLEDRRELDLSRLQALASDTSSRIRARVAIALGRLRRAEGAPLLLRLLADRDTAVAASAAFALGQLGDSTHAAALAARLASGDSTTVTVGLEAAHALGKVGGSEARETLLALLDTLPIGGGRGRLAGEALLAVWKTAPLPRLEPLERWLAAADADLRWKAAYALARGAGSRAAPRLLEVLSDPDPRVRAEALRALTAERLD